MTLAALIRKREAGKPANANPARVANDGLAKGRPLAGLAALALAIPTSPEVVPLRDPAAEVRRQRVLAMLAERPDIRYALITDARAEREAVILALATRGAMRDGSIVTCELRVPRAKYDPFLLLDLIERHGGTVH